MTIYLSGGSKSGKSRLAERCAAALAGDGPLYYLATMIPHDGEDRERISRHVAAREGLSFVTLEQGENILACLDRADNRGSFLLDSVTALLSNEMFSSSGVDPDAPERVAKDLVRLASSVENIVFVSDDIFSDGCRYDALTEDYRRGLAHIGRSLAAACGTVAEVCCGCPVLYKGVLPL